MNLVKRMAASAVVLAALSGGAFAQTPLVSGGFVTPVPTVAGATGTFITSLSSTFAGSNSPQFLSGTIVSAVYDRGGGLLDFWYQVSVDPTGPTSNSTSTAVNIASFIITTTAVAQAADADGAGAVFSSGTITAASAQRSGDGAGVQFNYTAPVGTTTFSFLVQTSGTNFAVGSAGVLASGISANANVLAPAAAGTQAPEPASVGLLALGSVAMGALIARRRK